jgi:hypothetical protein
LHFYQQQLAAYQRDRSAANQVLGVKTEAPAQAPELAALTLVANILLNTDEAITKE